MFTILILTTLILCLIIYRWKRRKFFQLTSKLPGNNKLSFYKYLRIIIHMLLYPKEVIIVGHKLIKDDQPITKIWLFKKLLILSITPEIVKTVLSSPQSYNRPQELLPSISGRNNLIFLDGEEHNRHRKILSKAFSPRMLKRFPEIFNKNSKETLKKMEIELNSGDFDILDYVGATALKNITQSAFNYEADTFRTEIYKKSISSTNALEAVTVFILFKIPPKIIKWTKAGRNFFDVESYFENHAKNIIEHNKQYPQDEADTFINLLLNPQNEFTEKEISDEILALYFTGFETTAKSISIAIVLLGMHQDVQQKLIHEIDQIFNTEMDISITCDFIQKFKYLDAVINETLRLFPIASLLSRTFSEDFDLNGYLIPKGTTFITNLYAMHRDEKLWGSDAHLFKPERFLEELKNPEAFMPFGAGKRLCLGYRYAKISFKIFLVNFLRTYKVFSSNKFEDIKVESMVSLHLVNGYRVSIERR